METFIYKEVTLKSKDGHMEVSRIRNTKGFGLIRIACRDNKNDDFKNIITLSNEKTGFRLDYEATAIELAEMIRKIAANPCLLPDTKDP